MSTRNDSPIIPTFAHARTLSSPTSPLACILEQLQPRTIHYRQTFLHSPNGRSPTTPKRDRFNSFFYSPSVASQRIYHNAQSSPTLLNEKCPSILSLPLLGAESDDESDDEQWNQGWDILNVQEMPSDNCRLPLITESNFKYYPEQSVQMGSAWSDSSDDSEDEDDAVEVAESVKSVETKLVRRKYEEGGFRRWVKMVLRKLTGRK
ncbi:hypothetical protein CC86DRAFT_177945 [Ophiobolus disseminans]|uniref:Uncharacterized protein n=1 Tax=Ophiobolus disseminans TaxID=1469910 RepID=A0A6A7AAQ5_9PLEO|nr:hypothetical protein CC86DRAFT_177945 [Ophiobolus disseminans]